VTIHAPQAPLSLVIAGGSQDSGRTKRKLVVNLIASAQTPTPSLIRSDANGVMFISAQGNALGSGTEKSFQR
jgi:hypothetical protein